MHSQTFLGEDQVEALAHGCAILSGGGGGETALAQAMTLVAVREAGPVELLDLDRLADDAVILPLALIGAPTVLSERIFAGSEAARIRADVEDALGAPVAAVMTAQIGGGSGVCGLMWAARLGLPLVDADGVGAAATDIFMTTMHLHGLPSSPLVLADPLGSLVRISATDNVRLARLAKGVAATLGGACVGGMYPMRAAVARQATVRRSVSHALALGAALGANAEDPVGALLSACDGRLLLRGRIVEVERRSRVGATHAALVIAGLADDEDRLMRLELQNEVLIAQVDGELVASAPDVISVLETASGHGISRESIRRGQRVSVVALPCDPVWRTPQGLALRGPGAFGYDLPYQPVEARAVADA